MSALRPASGCDEVLPSISELRHNEGSWVPEKQREHSNTTMNASLSFSFSFYFFLPLVHKFILTVTSTITNLDSDSGPHCDTTTLLCKSRRKAWQFNTQLWRVLPLFLLLLTTPTESSLKQSVTQASRTEFRRCSVSVAQPSINSRQVGANVFAVFQATRFDCFRLLDVALFGVLHAKGQQRQYVQNKKGLSVSWQASISCRSQILSKCIQCSIFAVAFGRSDRCDLSLV